MKPTKKILSITVFVSMIGCDEYRRDSVFTHFNAEVL